MKARLWLVLAAFWGGAAASEPLIVFAPASLKGALDEVVTTIGTDVAISYAGSAALARQVSQGAPADLILLANVAWMDWLEDRALIQPGTRRDILRNRLVLVAHQPQAVDLTEGLDLRGAVLAMGLARAVPAGIYARQTLEHFGLWPALEGQTAQTENVRHALALAALGEADYAFVYASDALAEPRVHVVFEVPEGVHDPIVYPGAVISDAQGALPFLDILATPQAGAIFRRHGFGLADGLAGR